MTKLVGPVLATFVSPELAQLAADALREQGLFVNVKPITMYQLETAGSKVEVESRASLDSELATSEDEDLTVFEHVARHLTLAASEMIYNERVGPVFTARRCSPHHLQIREASNVYAEWYPSKGTTVAHVQDPSKPTGFAANKKQVRGPKCFSFDALLAWLCREGDLRIDLK